MLKYENSKRNAGIGDEVVLFRKNFSQQTVNGVQMGNGIIASPAVKLNVHSFFVDGVLIDTGAKSLEKYFIPYFDELKIDKVVLTHFHEDHTGCAALLQKERKLPIFMNEKKIDTCKRKADYPFYRQLFWGRRKPFHAKPIGNEFSSQTASWRVIETPGHAVDHIAFLNLNTGQLFTGDLYCQVKTRVVLREESVPDIIQSLQNVLTYDFEEVFCCHAGYLSDGRKALQMKLEYLMELEGTIVKLYEEGKKPDEIDKHLFPKKYPITFFSGGEWASLNIVQSVIKDKQLISE